jgi:hypothetical protein
VNEESCDQPEHAIDEGDVEILPWLQGRVKADNQKSEKGEPTGRDGSPDESQASTRREEEGCGAPARKTKKEPENHPYPPFDRLQARASLPLFDLGLLSQRLPPGGLNRALRFFPSVLLLPPLRMRGGLPRSLRIGSFGGERFSNREPAAAGLGDGLVNRGRKTVPNYADNHASGAFEGIRRQRPVEAASATGTDQRRPAWIGFPQPCDGLRVFPGIDRSGGGGIRTHETPCEAQRLSRPPHSTALPPLRGTRGPTLERLRDAGGLR